MALDSNKLSLNIEKVLHYMSLEKTGWTDAARAKSLEKRRDNAKKRNGSGLSEDLDFRKKPWGHKEYYRKNPKTGVLEHVKAKGSPPIEPTAQEIQRDARGIRVHQLPTATRMPDAPVSKPSVTPSSAQRQVKAPTVVGTQPSWSMKIADIPVAKPLKQKQTAVSKTLNMENKVIDKASSNLGEYFSVAHNLLAKRSDVPAGIVVFNAIEEDMPFKRKWNSTALKALDKIQNFISNLIGNFKEVSKVFSGSVSQNDLKNLQEAVGEEQLNGKGIEKKAVVGSVSKEIKGYSKLDANKFFSKSKKTGVIPEKKFGKKVMRKAWTYSGLHPDYLLAMSSKTRAGHIDYIFNTPLNRSIGTPSELSALEEYFTDISGKKSIGRKQILTDMQQLVISVPREHPMSFSIGDAMETSKFKKMQVDLPVVLGKDYSGEVIVDGLEKMQNIILAGMTRQGKTNFTHNLISNIISTRTPDDVQLFIVDMKNSGLTKWNGIPHLGSSVVTQKESANAMLKALVKRMNDLNSILIASGHDKIEDFNDAIDKANAQYGTNLKKMKRSVVIIDELPTLLDGTPQAQEALNSLSELMAKGLSAGMQFVLSAQSPTRQMLDGRIQNNIQSRIAFKVGSSIDSRIALGYGLAEDAHKLSKPGEAYFKLPTKKQIMRLQAPYVPDSELKEFSRAMNAQTA